MSRNDTVPLLAAKVQPPRLSKGLVHRQRLEGCVDGLENYLLTVVNAPSGFGKTTLAAVWARELTQRAAIVSWLTLDKEDNDLSRFLRYLGYSIAIAGRQADHARPRDALPFSALKSREYVGRLINYITEVGDEFYVFVDDFHIVTSPEIQSHIQFLVQNAPSNLHLVLLSRAEKTKISIPKSLLPLEINANDLNFTVEETASLFGRSAESAAQVAQIHSATGGWAAALRILAGSDSKVLGNLLMADGSLRTQKSFAQLLNAVLSHLAPQEIRLIEMTSVVVRMCAPLFDALTGTADGQHLIERAEYSNGLISRITADGYWVGCHELVRQAMLARLADLNPELLNDVARRASHWYAQQKYWTEAVTQALAIDDQQLAVKWIEAGAAKFIQTGDVLALLSWDQALKLSRNKDTPDDILLALAFAYTLGGDGEHQADLPQLINERTSGRPDEHLSVSDWSWLALYGIFCCRNDDIDNALAIAERGLNYAPLHKYQIIEAYRNVAGYCYLHFRQWEKFYALPLVPKTGLTRNSLLSATYRLLLFGTAEITQANFSRAQRYLDSAYQASCEGLGLASLPSSLPGTLLAFIHYERLELNKAEHLLSEHLDVTASTGYIDIISHAFIAASRIAYLRKNTERALELLEQLEKLVLRSGHGRLQLICAYEKMRFFLAEAMEPQAAGCLAYLLDLYNSSFKGQATVRHEAESYVGLAQGQYAMAQGRFADAELLLERVYHAAASTSDIYMSIVSGTALAIAQSQNGNNQEALINFERVLQPAQAAGIKASVLYHAASIDPLLHLYQDSAMRDAKSWRHLGIVQGLLEQSGLVKEAVAVRLTPREKDILQLVGRGMSNKEISKFLGLSLETVKGYLKNILVKLEVNKRTAAVSRAASMGLI